MYQKRTDLALEAHELASKNKSCIVDGVIFSEQTDVYKVTRIEITSEKGEAATGKPVGKYITVDVGRIWERGCDELEAVCTLTASVINELSEGCGDVLVVGLGNTEVTADAIGPTSVEHLIVTRHLKGEQDGIFSDFFNISALSPGVLAQTGIESAEIVKSVAEHLSPSLIIAVDALASTDISRLGTVIQISNAGIAPGSGIGNHRARLCKENLGVPVLSIGVPTVVDALTMSVGIMESCGIELNWQKNDIFLRECENMFVTPKDCDKIISFMSRVIGYSINTAFHRSLTFDEIVSLRS